jgi:nucleotide-binding universal stress UspA family protein
MEPRRSVLCPIDFSEASRGALRYGRAIANHFSLPLRVVTVIDPLLDEVARLTGGPPGPSDWAALDGFVKATFDVPIDAQPGAELRVVVGNPAAEILRISHHLACALIVMSSHGLSGVRKLFFGSTTERVLRETMVPVLVTPSSITAASPDTIRKSIRRVLVPVDLSPTTTAQTEVARTIAAALAVPVLLTHVIKPARRLPGRRKVSGVDRERRSRAEQQLGDLVASFPPHSTAEAVVAYGDPAEEIAKLVQDRQVGLIVMGLHSSPITGPRMGSVTYRVLCLAHTLVLAVPPSERPCVAEIDAPVAESLCGSP